MPSNSLFFPIFMFSIVLRGNVTLLQINLPQLEAELFRITFSPTH